jgi:uncharacterized protein YkwD
MKRFQPCLPVAPILGLLLLSSLAAGRGEKPLTKDEQQFLELTNKERAKEKLPPLKINPVLTKVARAHSANMARQGKMEHNLDGKRPAQRVKESGYEYATVSENIARGEETPAEMMKLLMESPVHRKNILGPRFTEIGIGQFRAKDGRVYTTQVFAKPLEKE